MVHDEEKREVDLMEYLRIIEKRKWLAITFVSAIILFTAIFTFTAIPQYKATATLFIEEESSRVMNIEDEFGNPRQVTDMRTFNTQLGMLKSKNLAASVAERLNLLSRPELLEGIQPKKSPFSSVKNIITLKWLSSGKSAEEEKNPQSQSNPYSGYAGIIQANLKISPRRDTKLVDVSYTSRIPRLCAEVVNAYAVEFQEFGSSLRYERTKRFSNDLSKQIDTLRAELVSRQREKQRYGEEKGLILSDPESEEESAVFTKYRSLYDAYNQAVIEKNRIGAINAIVRDADIDSLPNIDDTRIQQLQTEYMNAKNDYDEIRRTAGSNNPTLIRAQDRLDRSKENLKQAILGIGAEYDKAIRYERSLRRELDQQESEISVLQSDIVFYQTLNYEVESLKTRLNSLLNIQTQVNASKELESLKTSNISVVDQAEVPNKPVSPNKKKNIMLAVLFGLFGGIGLCFLFEYLDNTIKGPEEVEKLTGLPLLGVIPLLEQDDLHGKERSLSEYGSKGQKEGLAAKKSETKNKDIELINHLFPTHPISDDYRTVRTSILLSHADSPPKIIALTSSLPAEGKSTTLVNLAIAFAQLEKKVLVIDSDIRKPRIHRIFKIGNTGGLSGCLAGKLELKDAIQKTFIKNLCFLPAGPTPPNPSELLNSAKMKEMLEEVKKTFDIVLLDTSPILAIIDAVIISTLVESTIMVLRAGEVTRKPFMSAVGELKRGNAHIMGVVFNGLKASEGKYFYRGNYPYYRYGYYGSQEAEKHQKAEH